MWEDESENYENTCTCCCIDCIGGDHCGGVFIDVDDDGNEEVIGICNNPEALLEIEREEYITELEYMEDGDDFYDDEDSE